MSVPDAGHDARHAVRRCRPPPAGRPDRRVDAATTPSRLRPSSRRAIPLPRVIAVANQKGGVGKTTTTINVGACLAELGQRTLIIDLDPQGNASTGLGIENRGLETSMYHVLMHEVPLENCIEPTDVKGLFVAPASLDLAGAEIELVPAFSRETRLRRAIEAVDRRLRLRPHRLPAVARPAHRQRAQRGPRGAGADPVRVLRPRGSRAAAAQRRPRAPQPQPRRCEVSTIVCVMYDARTKLADQVVSEVRDHFGDKVLRTIVPRSVRLSEAPSFGQPIITFDPRSRGAIAYRDVAKEVHDDSAQRAG